MKNTYKKFQIKYAVHAIVYEEVVAKTFEEAKERADKTMKGRIFTDRLECIDENTEFAGYDNMEAWDSVSP